jgi:DNA-binding NtrC family response regulator/CheY-like chemotaxis protein
VTTYRPCRIIVVDDDDDDRARIVKSLEDVEPLVRGAGEFAAKIEGSADAHGVARSIRETTGPDPLWDIVLADVMMPHPNTGHDPEENGAFHIARAIRDRYESASPPIRLAAISNQPGLIAASRGLREFDCAKHAEWFWYFVKSSGVTDSGEFGRLMEPDPWRYALGILIGQRRSERWGLYLLRTGKTIGELQTAVLRSASSQAVLAEIAAIGGRLEKEYRIVLLRGEPRVGKEIFARLLHEHRQNAARGNGRFVTYNCGTELEPNMLNSALFGHFKGAFTGAIADHQGIFEQASGGTVFLDEIGQLPEDHHRMLLRVLSDGEIQKVGGPRAGGNPVFQGNLIVLAASQPTEKLDGDLWSRINRVTVRVPPLRERPEDILGMATDFVERLTPGQPGRLDASANQWLLNPAWSWPQNFSTLEALLLKAFRHGFNPVITASDLDRASHEIESWRVTESPGAPVSAPATPSTPSNPKTRAEWDVLLAKWPRARNLAEWAEHFGFKPNTIRHKIRKEGWPPPELTGERRTPPRARRSSRRGPH